MTCLGLIIIGIIIFMVWMFGVICGALIYKNSKYEQIVKASLCTFKEILACFKETEKK